MITEWRKKRGKAKDKEHEMLPFRFQESDPQWVRAGRTGDMEAQTLASLQEALQVKKQ